jgi:hypothetical protein
MQPRPAVPVQPVTVTDEDASCYPVCGLTARRLRELVRAFDVPHVHLGRRMLVRVVDLERVLAKHATTTSDDVSEDDDTHVEPSGPTTADDYLHALGRRRTA